jgi:large subunit ribosomal protein L24
VVGVVVQALRKSRIRKGDVVLVITGRERGKSGKVMSVDLTSGKVIVEKLNIIKRHTKPNQKVKQGGILEREAPLAISNVMYVCPVTQKPTRVGIRRLEDGRRVRFSKKSNETFE